MCILVNLELFFRKIWRNLISLKHVLSQKTYILFHYVFNFSFYSGTYFISLLKNIRFETCLTVVNLTHILRRNECMNAYFQDFFIPPKHNEIVYYILILVTTSKREFINCHEQDATKFIL